MQNEELDGRSAEARLDELHIRIQSRLDELHSDFNNSLLTCARDAEKPRRRGKIE